MMEFLTHADDFNQLGQNVGSQSCWGVMGGSGMMGWWPMMSGGWFGGFFGVVIGILTILVLTALFRWLWHKGAQEGKERK